MVQYCCVPRCRGNALIKGISLHLFPKNEEMRKKWITRIQRDESYCEISETMRVCSLHFLPSDYKSDGQKIKRLKKNAVPSIFTFDSTPTPQSKQRKFRSRRRSKAENLQDQNSESMLMESDLPGSEETHAIKLENDAYRKEVTELKAEVNTLIKMVEDLRRDNRVLDTSLTMTAIKHDMKALKYYTGFDNFKIFKIMHSFMSADESISFSKIMKIEDQMLLVLAKLCHNFDFFDLAFRFNINEELAAFIFKKWINVLYSRLGSLNIWPRREIILEHVSPIFKEKYPNTILLLDVTRVKIDCPSPVMLQSQSYSISKSTDTLKGLVAYDPNGGIVFISRLFTSNISDKEIFYKSCFYDTLKQKLQSGFLLPGDSIMLVRGLPVREDLEALGLQVSVPLTLSGQQLDKEHVQKTRRTAPCCVFVKHATRRITYFKILRETINENILMHVNQIWTVCGLLCNAHSYTKKLCKFFPCN